MDGFIVHIVQSECYLRIFIIRITYDISSWFKLGGVESFVIYLVNNPFKKDHHTTYIHTYIHISEENRTKYLHVPFMGRKRYYNT